jgi:hypothetical protein
MKRIVVTALCAISFAACASKPEPVAPAAPAAETTQAEKSACGCSHKAAKKVACGGKSCTCEKGNCGK